MTYRKNVPDASELAGALTKATNKTLTDESASLGQTLSGQTGAAASVAALSGGIATITGLTGMSAQSPGRWLTLSGAASGGNNGTLLITEYISATSVKVSNASAVTPDANDGAISWAERSPYSLEDDVNFQRTDRAAIKGVAYTAAIPTYERPTAVGTLVPANLANLASKTMDAKAIVVNRKFPAQATSAALQHITLSSVGNLKHADAVDRIGVPIQDGADAGAFEASYVEVIDPTTESALEVKGNAFGSITPIAGASLVDGENFVLNDGVNPAVTFEFDSNASVIESATLRAVNFTGGDSVATVRGAIITAINSAPTLAITAAIGGVALVSLVNDAAGAPGNVAITETVANVGFVVVGMSGGGVHTGKRIYGRTRAGAATSPDSVEVEFRMVAKGAALSASSAYTWEPQHPVSVDLFYGFRERLDNLTETALRTVLSNGIVSDADQVQDIADIRATVGIGDGVTDLSGLLTNTGAEFVFSDLPDGTPSVVEAFNVINAQIGNRDYTGSILTDGQTVVASLQALANAIAASSIVRTVERLVADIDAGVPHTIPGAQSYTLDGGGNGQNLWLYYQGRLMDPGATPVNGDDYAETSTTSFTPHFKLKAGQHVNFFILQ